jgi:hypothetical protein
MWRTYVDTHFSARFTLGIKLKDECADTFTSATVKALGVIAEG